MQNDKAISYAYKQLKCYVKNHLTYDLELVELADVDYLWKYGLVIIMT